MRLSTSITKEGLCHNTRIKHFPDGSAQILSCSRRVFREPGWEDPGKWDRTSSEDPLLHRDSDPSAARMRAQRRAKGQIRDLALSNRFTYFVTLTLDQTRVDRYDIKAVTLKLNQWLDNQVRRRGLKYILVPELHKDGAIHFHGFFNDALSVVDSGTVIPPQGGKPRKPKSAKMRAQWLQNGGHVVYNLPQWSLGYTTAIALYGDYRSAVGYVCKYISKEQEKIGGRWFYHGGDLRKPDVELVDVNFEDVEDVDGAATFESPTMPGVRFAVLDVDGGGGECYFTVEQGDAGARQPAVPRFGGQGDGHGCCHAVHGRDAAF